MNCVLTARRGGREVDVLDFTSYGYDERQYCSPGINLPVGCFMRTPNGKYPQYHTSADDLTFVAKPGVGRVSVLLVTCCRRFGAQSPLHESESEMRTPTWKTRPLSRNGWDEQQRPGGGDALGAEFFRWRAFTPRYRGKIAIRFSPSSWGRKLAGHTQSVGAAGNLRLSIFGYFLRLLSASLN